jgi:hypothetical protein
MPKCRCRVKEEIARLKGHSTKPTIKPSRLEPAKQEKPKGGSHKRPGIEYHRLVENIESRRRKNELF